MTFKSDISHYNSYLMIRIIVLNFSPYSSHLILSSYLISSHLISLSSVNYFSTYTHILPYFSDLNFLLIFFHPTDRLFIYLLSIVRHILRHLQLIPRLLRLTLRHLRPTLRHLPHTVLLGIQRTFISQNWNIFLQFYFT